MSWGGKREGAGTQEGAVRAKLSHYWSQDDVKEYFDWLKTSYKQNPLLAKFVGEQIMGKAPQPLTGAEGGAIEHTITGVTVRIQKA